MTEEQTLASVRCQGISPSKVDALWSRIEPLIEKGLEYCIHELRPSDIKQSLLDEDMQLWAGFDLDAEEIVVVMVTELINYPTMRICNIVTNGGSRVDEWEPFMETVKEWASMQGCVKIKAMAREGWGRRLEKYGYEKAGVIISVDLTEG